MLYVDGVMTLLVSIYHHCPQETHRADIQAPLGMLTAVGLAAIVGWCVLLATKNPSTSQATRADLRIPTQSPITAAPPMQWLYPTLSHVYRVRPQGLLPDARIQHPRRSCCAL